MTVKSKTTDKRRSWRRWRRRIAIGAAGAIVLPIVAWFALNLIFPFPVEQIEAARRRQAATLVLDREGVLLRPFLGQEETWLFWVGLDQVSPRLIEAAVAVEDERFWRHPGVDPLAVARAAWGNLRSRRITSGASTITMQTIRLIAPRPRTWWSKLVEAFRATQLERLRTKRQILEIYFNLCPYGGNLLGPEAAAQAYFHKRAADLTLGESALVAGLVQSPSRFRPDRHPERAQRRRDHVLRRMETCGYITGEQCAVALKQPVPLLPREPFPFEAPHFAEMVRCAASPPSAQPLSKHEPCEGLYRPSQGCSVRTTLDRRIQSLAEEAVREGVGRLRPEGVTNGAVVAIENATGAVRALVGSCDFASEEDRGQINGATAARSPGSALKPFIYALAFDQGIAAPATVLADVPVSFVAYEPENYDHRFRGPVSAREALASSLNVPAVNLLERVGQRKVYAALCDLGLGTLREEPGRYGLSLALGSAEVRLLDLTNAYAALARLGVYRPYRLLETEPVAEGRRVLGEGAAWMVAEILSDMQRTGGRGLWRSDRSPLRMAWKTGTSFGHRDAWTVAYTPRYTVGVWLGNFDGRSSRRLVGIEAAAPVAAQIMEQLHADSAPAWFEQPESVALRRVCPVSGMPVGEHCPGGVTDCGLRDVGAPTCTVHVQVRVDIATGTRLCPACPAGRSCRTDVVEQWPVELTAWFRKQGSARAQPLPHFAGCASAADERARPRILSPAPKQAYLLNGGANERVLLKASASGARLYWFIDGALYRSCAPNDAVFWQLRPGEHRISCADEAGRSAGVVISVE